MLRLAGEAVCCLASLISCCRSGAKCCANGCKKGEEEEAVQAEAAPEAEAAPVRKDVGQLMSLVLMIVSILLALIWEFYFATSMDKQKATKDAWCEPPGLNVEHN